MMSAYNQSISSITNPTWNAPPENNHFSYLFVPLYGILFFLGTFGNGLVIISILRSSRLRTVTNTYLLHMAIADFLLLLSIPFFICTILANGWIFGSILCKMYFNFIHINQYVGSLLLAALSLDRYLAVCHPIRAIEFRTRTKCAVIIAGCWFISFVFIFPTWFFAKAISEQYVVWFGYRVEKCVIDFSAFNFKIQPEIIFTYYGFLLGFLFPVCMITTFYILVLVRLNHIRHKHRSELKQRSHRKVTRIVLAVITAYFICWVPYWFVQIFIATTSLSVSPNMRFLKELVHFTMIIGYVNNCLNPVLYVFLSESFREEYLIVLNCFSLSRCFSKSLIDHELEHRTSYDPEQNPSIPIQFNSHEELARKKIKHSVAIDEIPLQYRSSSVYCQQPEKRNSVHLPILRKAKKQKENKSQSKSTDHQSRLLMNNEIKGNKKSMGLVVTFKESNRSSPVLMDDGGVYCGN